MANDFSQFKDVVRKLVEKCDEFLAKGPLGFKGQPEAETKQKFVEPLLRALNYTSDDYIPEHKIKARYGPVLGWVDYGLQGDGTTVAFVEAKQLFDKDLWRKHETQIRRYIRDYLLTLQPAQQPTRWIIITNFAELHVLNIVDRQPYFSLTYDQYLENADRLWTLFECANLQNDLIFADYSESRQRSLGKEFLQDLKQWRLILANGYRTATPDLAVSEAKSLSQQLLDRLILLRVLETSGLQSYYSVVRAFEYWQRTTRNKDKLGFYYDLQRLFVDLELDLNTELFKDDLRAGIELAVKGRGKPVNLVVPNDFLQAAIIPDEPWTERVRGLMKGKQLHLAYSTVYNYDFRALTDDVMGSVYEQFLAHELVDHNGGIAIESSAELRQREGAYYTPTPVVRYLVQEAVGKDVRDIAQAAVRLIGEDRYAEAKTTIDRLSGLKVVDIACGSGAFLIEAFDVFLDGYRRYNRELHQRLVQRNEGFAPLLEGGGLVEDEGERIIRDNLFGIDKDDQAIEVAKVNLWLKLLRSNPQMYARSASKAPARLPELVRNLHARDSIVPRDDLSWLWEGADKVVVVGNPPWGADLSVFEGSLDPYTLAARQYDSYELFIERAVDLLPDGGRLAYLVPDSILHLPEHEPLRQMLLDQTRLEHVIKLGEGVFEHVFRAAVAVVLEKGKPSENHRVSVAVVVKADRTELLQKNMAGKYLKTIGEVEEHHGHTMPQMRFKRNQHQAFEIYTKDADEPIRAKIAAKPLNWSILWTGRGAEITGKGLIVQCPSCGTWNNIPQRRKDGTYNQKVCGNSKCGHAFDYDDKAVKATIVSDTNIFNQGKPFVIGENINRYRIVKRLFIDTSRTKALPRCPNCGDFDATWPDLSTGHKWYCPRCSATFGRTEVTREARLGVNYKPPDFYQPPKMLVRKTGRGIYATIDHEDSCTNQVVFIFRLRHDLKGNDANYSLWYILGVLNSKTMLYEYYKRTADIEWKSFPYLTQETIMKLPVPRIDFSNLKEKASHDEIARLAQRATARNGITEAEDESIESLVMDLYQLTPGERADVRNELAEIARYGTLLGSHDEIDNTEETDVITRDGTLLRLHERTGDTQGADDAGD